MALHDDDRVAVSPDVLSRVLDGEAVLLDLASGTYFGLNEVATAIWQLVQAGTTVGQLRAKLLDEFDVPPDVLAADLEELLEALEGRGLVRLGRQATGG